MVEHSAEKFSDGIHALSISIAEIKSTQIHIEKCIDNLNIQFIEYIKESREEMNRLREEMRNIPIINMKLGDLDHRVDNVSMKCELLTNIINEIKQSQAIKDARANERSTVIDKIINRLPSMGKVIVFVSFMSLFLQYLEGKDFYMPQASDIITRLTHQK